MLISNLIILSAILILLVILSMVWPPDSPWAPWWKTNSAVAEAMCKLGKISKKDTLYELGCGDATALITAVKQTGAEGVGIEIDPIRAGIASVRVKANRLDGSVTIMRENFFDVSFAEASIVFVYLVPKALRRLKQKFFHELPKGARIISYRYEIDYLPLVAKDKKHELYLYTVPSKQAFPKVRKRAN